ncbi:hypothetical protein [Mycoplasma miroungirhinis]|uniref:Lipoprotein n=1 Tax=Mycoplasma miroungirhinis TaxID=754516 RepID=A0A6M4JBH0_9MOLU|nr:hypothetical protein [Mycoplasma miroungirhinis]QJR44304.1 hypothetical protein HLA92_02585 [Mycoplasma miroungirhinis]
MKNKIKWLFVSLSFITLGFVPIISISCSKVESVQEPKIEYKKLQNVFETDIKPLENVFLYKSVQWYKIQDFIQKFNQINSMSDNKFILNLWNDIQKFLSEFNLENQQEQHGILINKYALGQENVLASDVVNELINQTSWIEVQSIFKKYSIIYKEMNVDSMLKLNVSKNTHAHNNVGKLHLIIEITKDNNKFSILFDVFGFKLTDNSK